MNHPGRFFRSQPMTLALRDASRATTKSDWNFQLYKYLNALSCKTGTCHMTKTTVCASLQTDINMERCCTAKNFSNPDPSLLTHQGLVSFKLGDAGVRPQTKT